MYISLFKSASRDNNPSLRDFSARTTILSIVPVKSKFSDNITFLNNAADVVVAVKTARAAIQEDEEGEGESTTDSEDQAEVSGDAEKTTES